MTTRSDTADLSGIQFFGKMAASMTHDIKNVLAVINENAGLLEDICFMADRGKPADLARLKRIAGDIKEQVRRADRIVTAMNHFAHSSDEASTASDLGELIALLASLAMRVAAMRGVSLRAVPVHSPVVITTFPFGLLNLLWICLDRAMTAVGSGKTMELIVEKTTEGGRVRFRGHGPLGAASVAECTLDRLPALIRALKAKITADAADTEIVVQLPRGLRV